MPANILIADDHPLFRRGIADLIQRQAEFNLVAEAGSGTEVLKLLPDKNIDVALLDIQMPGHNGIELLEMIKSKNISVKVILLTMHDDAIFAKRAFELGARGYLLKEDTEAQIINCITTVLNGDTFSSVAYSNDRQAHLDLNVLSKSEYEIFMLVSTGKTSLEISDLLNKSVRTVDNHRSNIASKLGLRGPNSLLKYAIAYNKII